MKISSSILSYDWLELQQSEKPPNVKHEEIQIDSGCSSSGGGGMNCSTHAPCTPVRTVAGHCCEALESGPADALDTGGGKIAAGPQGGHHRSNENSAGDAHSGGSPGQSEIGIFLPGCLLVDTTCNNII